MPKKRYLVILTDEERAQPASLAKLVETLDKNVAAVSELLKNQSDEICPRHGALKAERKCF
jgi:hypothetical protein